MLDFQNPPIESSITYEVTGSADIADITLRNSEQGIEQLEGCSLPWTRTFSVTVYRNNFYQAWVSAQNMTEEGTITVKIFKNGALQKSATSYGRYVMASVSYNIQN
jgi:hypothetical protein